MRSKAADRILFMDEGRIIEEGTPAELVSNPRNERTQKFLTHGDGRSAEHDISLAIACRARLASRRLAGLGKPGFAGAAPFRAMARTAERGGLDAVLLGLPTAPLAVRAQAASTRMQLDPLPLLGSLIGATQRIGLCGYWPVDFTEPFHVARVFATLDHLADGRTGWIAGSSTAERARCR